MKSEVIAQRYIKVAVLYRSILPFLLICDVDKTELIVHAKIYLMESISETYAQTEIKTL